MTVITKWSLKSMEPEHRGLVSRREPTSVFVVVISTQRF